MEDPTKTAQSLSLNFTIPKRKLNGNETKNDSGEKELVPAPVLQDAYDSTVTPSYPPPPAPAAPFNAMQAVLQFAEKRKIEAALMCNNSYLDSNPAVAKELNAMFQPLFCKLCDKNLSSSIVAKSHYKGKLHEKNVRKYLLDYAERTEEPLEKRAKIMESSKTESPDDKAAKYFYCELCDLKLNGRLHAESHYIGKKHQRVVNGKGAPAGRGHYDANGKWVRTKPVKNDTAGREDGFGLDFAPTPSASELRCDICDVEENSLAQMEIHYNGKRHKKKLNSLGLDLIENKTTPSSSTKEATSVEESIISCVMDKPPVIKDLSVFRTPSGQYYCKLCNLTVYCEIQFKQHLNSKNHAKRLNRTQNTT